MKKDKDSSAQLQLQSEEPSGIEVYTTCVEGGVYSLGDLDDDYKRESMLQEMSSYYQHEAEQKKTLRFQEISNESIRDAELGENFRLQRSTGSRLAKQKLDDLLIKDDNDHEITDDNICWTLNIRVFTIFFPDEIRNHVSQTVQLIGGGVLFLSLIVGFIWLFILFNQCDELMTESSEIPDGSIRCDDGLLTQQSILQIDVNGKWSIEEQYDRNKGGPWEVAFSAFQATQEIFDETKSQIKELAQELVNSLEDRTFFEILQEFYFYRRELKSTSGTATLQANINLPIVFKNYEISGFSLVDLKKGLLDSWQEIKEARLESTWERLSIIEQCKQSKAQGGQHAFDVHRVCNPSAEYDTTTTSQHWVDGSTVKTASYLFYPSIMKHLYPNSTEDQWYRKSDDELTVDWNFGVLFTYDYCNKGGREFCMQMLNLSNTWDQDSSKEFPYYSVQDFFEVLGNQYAKESIQYQSEFFLLEQTVYINSLQQFGFFAGRDYIYTPKNYNVSSDVNFLQEQGYTVEYVIVPQLSLATPNLQATKILGQPYFLCESCQQRRLFLDLLGDDQIDTEACKQSAYIFLHLYAFPFTPNLTGVGVTTSNSNFTIENNYIVTFVYRLSQEIPKFTYFSKDVHNQYSLYFYNYAMGQMGDLHCRPQQWALKPNINISNPFTLSTGIYSCLIRKCPSLWESLGDAQATSQLLYYGILFILIIGFVCVILPKARSRKHEKREKFVEGLYESIASIARSVT